MDWAQYDSVTSTPADYRNLAPFVLDRALRECGTVLMEPLYRYHMEIPNTVNGKALYDIERMRGVVENVEAGAEMTILTGTVPAETARDYAKELLSYTAGKGMLSLEAIGYQDYHGDIVAGESGRSLEWELIRGGFIAKDGFLPPR
jgi:ribosomal protection tetracycline resistance protein